MTERWTEQMGWRDTRGGWEWDMRWLELGTTRERNKPSTPDQENREESNQEDERKDENQNRDSNKRNKEKESTQAHSNQYNKDAKRCNKPAVVNKEEEGDDNENNTQHKASQLDGTKQANNGEATSTLTCSSNIQSVRYKQRITRTGQPPSRSPDVDPWLAKLHRELDKILFPGDLHCPVPRARGSEATEKTKNKTSRGKGGQAETGKGGEKEGTGENPTALLFQRRPGDGQAEAPTPQRRRQRKDHRGNNMESGHRALEGGV